jgi:hypothetical protein
MDENKVIRPMDFIRLTSIDESKVIKDTENHIGLVKEVSPWKRVSVMWIGNTYSRRAWFSFDEVETIDNMANLLTREMANLREYGKDNADKFYPIG